MNYYKRHKKALNVFYENIEKIIKKYSAKKEWIIFGSSRISGMIIHYLHVKRIQISYIIDNDIALQRKTAFHIPVYKPENLLQPKRENIIILIASAHQDTMICQLENMGYLYGEDIIKVIDLPELMSDFTFEDRSGLHKMTIEEVREHQLGILEYLKKICQEYGLEYFITGGTLLGSVRHKGYIPWDDDIDVQMFVNDVRMLSEILKKDKRYKLISIFDEDLDYFDECSLMVDTETIMDMNRFPIQSTTGVSIDIFMITGIPDGQAGKNYILEARQLETECYNSLYSNKECKKNIEKFINCITRYHLSECNQAANVTGRNFYREIVDKSAFEHHLEMPFEHHFVWAPIGYQQILKQFYGNYMQLPPKEQQIAHHYFNAYWNP